VKTLAQGQQILTFSAAHAGEHDRETRHEEAWTRSGPSSRIVVARHTEFQELLFVVPVEVRRKMTVGGRVRRLYFQHTKPRADGVRQGPQSLEIAGLAAAKARQCFLADLGPLGPFGIGKSERPSAVAQNP
jgi:hypothetical protein